MREDSLREEKGGRRSLEQILRGGRRSTGGNSRNTPEAAVSLS